MSKIAPKLSKLKRLRHHVDKVQPLADGCAISVIALEAFRDIVTFGVLVGLAMLIAVIAS
jgi:hypothetical protein